MRADIRETVEDRSSAVESRLGCDTAATPDVSSQACLDMPRPEIVIFVNDDGPERSRAPQNRHILEPLYRAMGMRS